jgi:ammonium transporter, Amt family
MLYRTTTRLATVLCFASFALSDFALAAEDGVVDTGDTAWMLTATAIVLLMTIPGVALFYAGMVRKINILATLMQSFAITCLISVIWMIIGYSLAFSDGGSDLLGNMDFAFLAQLSVNDVKGTIPDSVFIGFQLTFAIITAALITGAVAERMKFSALMWFVGLWSIIVYSPVAFWVWGGGFLSEAGILDFAGGTVVHINSGVAALVAAIMVGKRTGYGEENLAPHNLVLTMIGGSLLWVGWFGFNAGSAVGSNGLAGMAMLVTQIAAAAAALTWMLADWVYHRKPTVLGIVSGAVAGLVAITPASGFVGPVGALVIGVLAGFVCYWGVVWLKDKLGYDDALDVFGIHGLGGITGAILTGVFAAEAVGGKAGALEGNVVQVAVQIYGILVTIIWSSVASAAILFAIDKAIGLRVGKDDESRGLDLSQHGETLR